MDYPKGTVGADTDKFLAGVVERNVGQLKGKVSAEEKVTLGKDKHPGRDVRVDLPDKKQFYRARVFLVGDRVYQIVVLGPEEAAQTDWLAWRVHRAFGELPETERSVLELAYWGGLSQSEVANFLGIPLGTVKTRTRSGLARMADLLGGEDLRG